MTAVSLFTTIVSASKILRELEHAGLRVNVSTDFVAYKKLRDRQTNRMPLYPVFDVSSSFIDASNAFWVGAYNDKDELVHTQVIRMLDLHGSTLHEHLGQHHHNFLSPGMVSDPDEISFTPLKSLKTITGRVCYHGEFWLKDGEGSLRGQGYTALMSRLLFELSLNSWTPDYLFGFVPLSLAMKGIPFRYGYTRCEVGVLESCYTEIAAEEALVWMSRADLNDYLQSAPKALRRSPRITAHEEATASVALSA